jgi:hypothetical protein
MDRMLEDLARSAVADRLAGAEGLRRGRRHTAADRLARRAQAAARRASLALARAE